MQAISYIFFAPKYIRQVGHFICSFLFFLFLICVFLPFFDYFVKFWAIIRDIIGANSNRTIYLKIVTALTAFSFHRQWIWTLWICESQPRNKSKGTHYLHLSIYALLLLEIYRIHFHISPLNNLFHNQITSPPTKKCFTNRHNYQCMRNLHLLNFYSDRHNQNHKRDGLNKSH